jgi:hypothetical protein
MGTQIVPSHVISCSLIEIFIYDCACHPPSILLLIIDGIESNPYTVCTMNVEPVPPSSIDQNSLWVFVFLSLGFIFFHVEIISLTSSSFYRDSIYLCS